MSAAGPGIVSIRSMRASMSLRAYLRDATQAEQVQLDAAISTLDLSNPRDYTRFLLIHHSALSELRRDCRPSDCHDLDEMQRCLDADLARCREDWTSAEEPKRRSVCNELHRSAGYPLGAAYVWRGSRLGPALLKRRTGAASPSAYLSYRPNLSWATFLEGLDRYRSARHQIGCDEVINAAKEAFGSFIRIYRV